MKKSLKFSNELPTSEQIRAELNRVNYKSRFKQVMQSTMHILLVVAAISILVATIWMPVLQIYGTSMVPTLNEGNVVVAIKTSDFSEGDLVSFYLSNKLLIRRYIAGPGQLVDIDDKGNVYVDGMLLDEPYVTDKAFGECNIELPYLVPENRIFCLGDNRVDSVDSRNTVVGCVAEEQIVGKIVFRVWPLTEIGMI